eukprot:TRINITY_DN54350_c0_g1_i1.p1 TRINITY_DN54350_c0_g1~~TRINITY_DN54350_c0_g1_i1.p1  ORF type:complete len:797 (+),score=107.72 TRINITY_DN54350_c0_g1_i1:135-2525(+)
MVATPDRAYSSYRLRLARGSELPADLYGDAPEDIASAWSVRELHFSSDAECGVKLPIARALASVAVDLAPAAFDADVGTSWRSLCQESGDAVNQCRRSWLDGAWVGATLELPASVACVSLNHDGAAADVGLVLDAWDEATAAWLPLQAFSSVLLPDAPVRGASAVRLRRLPDGGACRSPMAVGGDWRPACTPLSQWRVVSLDPLATWVVYELQVFGDEMCSNLLPQGTPIALGTAPASASRLVDGATSTGLALGCGASKNASLCRNEWVGISLSQAVPVRCARIYQAYEHLDEEVAPQLARFQAEVWDGSAWTPSFNVTELPSSGGWSYLPSRGGTGGSLWRLVNNADIELAWAVQEVVFYATATCSDEIPGGTPLSSDDAGPRAAEADKAFDGDVATSWVSSCAPCAAGRALIGQAFAQSIQAVRCISLTQALDPKYHPSSVSFQMWRAEKNEWGTLRVFDGLMGGMLQLSPSWGAPRTRMVVANAAETLGGWRVAELRLYRSKDCTGALKGVYFSSEDMSSAAALAFDSSTGTHWQGSCCMRDTGINQCRGCMPYDAFVGLLLPVNETVNCVQMMQVGASAAKGPPLYVSQKIALREWDGYGMTDVFVWDYIPNDEWVQLSVGVDRSPSGANQGCADNKEWTNCNATSILRRLQGSNPSNDTLLPARANWNCSRYRYEGMCNETFDANCEGVPITLACRSSCCLCESNNPQHCGIQVVVVEELPPWVVPVAASAGGLLLVGLVVAALAWKRRWCHHRRCCRRCCRSLDRCWRSLDGCCKLPSVQLPGKFKLSRG